MTGDERYLQPLRSMAMLRMDSIANPPDSSEAGGAGWVADQMRRFLREGLAKYRQMSGSDEFDSLLLADADAYVRYRLTGDVDGLTSGLADSQAALGVNRAGYTSEVRFTDRVFKFHSKYVNQYADESIANVDVGLIYQMVTGDFGDPLYLPLNAVRWKTEPQDIAVLVTESGAMGFSAELYHFGEESREMGADLFMLDEDTYNATLTCGDNEVSRSSVNVDEKRGSVMFTLPPRQLCLLEIVAS
jgi:hypothetical protein